MSESDVPKSLTLAILREEGSFVVDDDCWSLFVFLAVPLAFFRSPSLAPAFFLSICRLPLHIRRRFCLP